MWSLCSNFYIFHPKLFLNPCPSFRDPCRRLRTGSARPGAVRNSVSSCPHPPGGGFCSPMRHGPRTVARCLRFEMQNRHRLPFPHQMSQRLVPMQTLTSTSELSLLSENVHLLAEGALGPLSWLSSWRHPLRLGHEAVWGPLAPVTQTPAGCQTGPGVPAWRRWAKGWSRSRGMS